MNAILQADARGQWLCIMDAEDVDAAQLSGRWLKSTSTMEIRR